MIQPVGWIEFKILDKNGTLEKMFKKPMESFVRQYCELNAVDMGSGTVQIRDTTNNLRGVGPAVSFLLNSAALITAYGIIVGTGSNAVNISDYKLQTQIAHGNGAGQLYHQACLVGYPSVVGSSAFFSISRNFNNNSGGTITVEEVGMASNTGGWYFLLARDLTGGINVLDTKTLAAVYTFTITA